MTRLVQMALTITLLGSWASSQSPQSATGTVRGVVLTLEASAARAVVPAAQLSQAHWIETRNRPAGAILQHRGERKVADS